MKGAEVAANTVEFLAIMGIIPDGGATLRSVCIAVRGVNVAYDKVRTINKVAANKPAGA